MASKALKQFSRLSRAPWELYGRSGATYLPAELAELSSFNTSSHQSTRHLHICGQLQQRVDLPRSPPVIVLHLIAAICLWDQRQPHIASFPNLQAIWPQQ